MSEQAQRAAVVAEARKWLATPYHHRAHVLGVGCDCLYLLVEAFSGAGLIPQEFDPGVYSKQWFLHRSEERYLAGLEQFVTPVLEDDTPLMRRSVDPDLQSGDILMFQHGRTFSHSAIVTDWPYVIHASAPAGSVVEESLKTHAMATKRMRAYSYWGAR